jgi:hypothetical protein
MNQEIVQIAEKVVYGVRKLARISVVIVVIKLARTTKEAKNS